jgi:hypothetical protein
LRFRVFHAAGNARALEVPNIGQDSPLFHVVIFAPALPP